MSSDIKDHRASPAQNAYLIPGVAIRLLRRRERQRDRHSARQRDSEARRGVVCVCACVRASMPRAVRRYVRRALKLCVALRCRSAKKFQIDFVLNVFLVSLVSLSLASFPWCLCRILGRATRVCRISRGQRQGQMPEDEDELHLFFLLFFFLSGTRILPGLAWFELMGS